MTDIIDELKKCNQDFIQNNAYGNILKDDIFEFENYNSNLILTAPHSTKSYVAKEEKIADMGTGALVKVLSEKKHVSNITRTKFVKIKSLISEFIEQKKLQEHYFLDIHGFGKETEFDICLGTGYYDAFSYPYLDNILKAIEKYDLKVAVNHKNYTGRIGLTGRYQKRWQQANVLQIELQKDLRDFYNQPEKVKNITIPLLTEIIEIYSALGLPKIK